MNSSQHKSKQWFTTKSIFIASIAGAGLYYLWIEHHSHLTHFLPYAIFLLCPVIHIFMHGGHSHKQSGNTAMEEPGQSAPSQSLPEGEPKPENSTTRKE
ncbi:DUF2933 domain-containing protein [Halieaceae bacterium IMCC14734]|uniref:DUF2933 domain-containing protein n=1 Tax=Candidatus Litorirhabdus singularis TaxID=2518993 RepID=A0ABT3TK89_9GAMM|nr:DUF2933 domain-containing protein [Candidatus Litorirhabdus singularis]MCX2982698.1 DUF2933 domain-containing protein [Candidatus Litorirhabdus singularis]